jgi:hypothetical protein
MGKTLLVCLSVVLSLVGSVLFAIPVQAEVDVAPSSLSFGNVNVNTKSAPLAFVVTNESSHAHSISEVHSTVPEFYVIGPAMPLTLAAHSSAKFQVAFLPNAVSSYTGDVVLSMKNGEGQPYSVSVAVHGAAKSAAASLTYLLSGSASSLTFANTLVGSSAAQTISLANSGTGALTISQATVSGTGFTLSGFSGAVSLAPGKKLALTVSFAPTTAGAVSGSLTVVSNAAQFPASIPVSGTGVQPQISVLPANISFSAVSVGVTDTQTLTIKNTGTANLTITQASLAGSAFTLSGLPLPLSLAPGSSSTCTVGFTPASASSFYANLSLVNNTPSSPLVIPMAGTSVSSVLQLKATPPSLAFGNVPTGTSSTQTVTLTNTGNASISISSISLTGAGFTPTGFTLPLTLAAGQSTSFRVVFAPTIASTPSGSVTVNSNASNSPLVLAVTGTGIAPASHSVSLGWTPSSSSFAGFNVYRGTQSGGPYTKANSGLISTEAYDDTNVSSGQSYYYVATEVDSAGVESGYSTQVSATIP